MKKNYKLAFIGCGNMGEALIKGLLGKNFISSKNIIGMDISKERLRYIKKTYSVEAVQRNRDAVKKGDIIILAVKPQDITTVLKEIAGEINRSKLLISIAAGVSLKFIESFSSSKIRLIRVMPNTPALIQEGAAALSKGNYATEDDLETARKIFNTIGKTVIIDEKLMDAVTGLSGSGPAYIFTIVEALIAAGVKMGLSREVSQELSVQTLLGSAKMIVETGEHPARLRDMVTSPGGTTVAGLHVLEKEGLSEIIMNAIEAATKRSKELGKFLSKKKEK
ncbi:MAG TPA: pyrroline-5-carboxylate reductase [Nitrospinota bacterium]|nr:pyrroline-5-carboxylate reductase [Nitrospinota bacterium]